MSYTNEERENVKAMMNLFVAINKLSSIYTIDQSIDVLDIYFVTGQAEYISSQDGIRDFIVNSNLREEFLPIYSEGYNHLADYIDSLFTFKNKSK